MIKMGRAWILPCKSYFENELEIDIDHVITYSYKAKCGKIQKKNKEIAYDDEDYYPLSDLTWLLNEYILSSTYVEI